jgi:hypothetical protein
MTKEAITTDAISTFRAGFSAPGIRKVCGWAHAAESSGRYATAAKSVETLKGQIAKAADGSVERMHLEADLKAMEAKACEFSTLAINAATNCWKSHEALQLVERDLERFCNDLSAAVEKGITDTRKFYNASGWGSPPDEIILATVAPLATQKRFLQEHAEPALQTFRAQLEVSAAGQKLSDAFQPDALASWLVFGCGSREIPMT